MGGSAEGVPVTVCDCRAGSKHRVGSSGHRAGSAYCVSRGRMSHIPGIAGRELMPSRRRIARSMAFPRPRMPRAVAGSARGSAAHAAVGPATAGKAPVIAPAVETAAPYTPVRAAAVPAMEAAVRTAASMEATSAASVHASTSAAMAPAMLGESGRGEENQGEGYDS